MLLLITSLPFLDEDITVRPKYTYDSMLRSLEIDCTKFSFGVGKGLHGLRFICAL